jgi:DNA-binding LacI/PurR family transcriptional regulator
MKTVSNVANDYEHVTPSMRKKVQRAIDDLGYKPNLTARRLATGRTGMIALAIPETHHPYFSAVADAVVTASEQRGYRVLIEQTDWKSEREIAVLRDREAGLVDGVIFQPSTVSSLEIAQLQGTPLVLLGEAAMPLSIDHVMIDNVEAAKKSVEHLIALGRKRIAFLGVVENDNAGATMRRLAGYQAALEHAGIVPDPKLVLTVSDFTPDAAKATMLKALQEGVGFDGVLCRDDRFAVAALQSMRLGGAALLENISIIGWDDTELSQYAFPTLTSVSPNKQAIAEIAVDMLLERIEGFTGMGRHRLAPFKLTLRDSAPRV